MKHNSQEVTFPLNYTFPGDVDYIPGEGDNWNTPYFAPEIFLLRAKIELEDGSEIDAPQWVIDMVNLGGASTALLLRQYEDWLADEAMDAAAHKCRSMASADCKFCAY